MNHGSKKATRTPDRKNNPDTQKAQNGLNRLLANSHSAHFSLSEITSEHVTVLLVEDQPLMRKAFKRVLESHPAFNVYESHNPKDAIQLLRNHSIDLVILDLYLNQGSGMEVLNYVRSRPIANDVPIVFVSGEASRDDIVHAIELGVNDYLIKPFEPHELMLKVVQVLKQYMNPTPLMKQLREAEADLIRGRSEEAHKKFSSLYEKNPDSPRVLVGFAQAEIKLQHTERAKELIEHAIKISDMCFPAYALMADLLIQEGNKTGAIEFLLREVSLNGKRVGRRVQLAQLYFELHDYRSGLDQMRMGLIDFPNDEDLLLKTAQLQMESGDMEKALHYYLKTRRNVPRSSMALKGISDVCLKSGNGKKAVQIFTDFLNQKPNQADVLHARSTVLEKMNRLEEALTDVEACLALEPDRLETMALKGRLLKKTGQEMPSRMMWAAMTRIDPSAETMTQIGFINFNAGDFAQAILYFERAIFTAPNHRKALYHLAVCYKNLGQNGKALAACQQALAMMPGAQEFKELVTDINTKNTNKKNGGNNLPQAG